MRKLIKTGVFPVLAVLMLSCGLSKHGAVSSGLKAHKMLMANEFDQHKYSSVSIQRSSMTNRDTLSAPAAAIKACTGLTKSILQQKGQHIYKKHAVHFFNNRATALKKALLYGKTEPADTLRQQEAPQGRRLETISITAFCVAVLGGALALMITFLESLPMIIIVGLLAIVLGIIGLIRTQNKPGVFWGRGFAIAAIIIGIAEVVFIGLILLIFLAIAIG